MQHEQNTDRPIKLKLFLGLHKSEKFQQTKVIIIEIQCMTNRPIYPPSIWIAPVNHQPKYFTGNTNNEFFLLYEMILQEMKVNALKNTT